MGRARGGKKQDWRKARLVEDNETYDRDILEHDSKLLGSVQQIISNPRRDLIISFFTAIQVSLTDNLSIGDQLGGYMSA